MKRTGKKIFTNRQIGTFPFFLRNKRGVTPLVATLILISFSVGLGAIVMSWGQSYIENTAEFITAAQAQPLGCDSISIGLITIGGGKQLCVISASQTVKALVENGPKADVDNLQARIVGSDGVDTIENILSSPLTRAASATSTFSHKAIGTVRQIKLTPHISINGKPTYCTNKAIIVDEPINQCG